MLDVLAKDGCGLGWADFFDLEGLGMTAAFQRGDSPGRACVSYPADISVGSDEPAFAVSISLTGVE